MDDKRFWDVIAVGCPHDREPDEWNSSLVAVLKLLDPDDIVRFDHWLEGKASAAYSNELWSVASLINGGASDDGFAYFRLWLVGMGKKVYEAALANPDTLADIVDPQNDDEAEIYGVALHAWEALGLSEEGFYGAHSAETNSHKGPLEVEGEWVRREDFLHRFPRLAALYRST